MKNLSQQHPTPRKRLASGWSFGECPLSLSDLQYSQYDINKHLFVQSKFAHIKYNSPTARNSTRSHSCIRCGHSLITLEFPLIVNAYLLVQLSNHHVLFVTQHGNNTFPTAKRAQHVTPNNAAIFCVGMLRSFGLTVKMNSTISKAVYSSISLKVSRLFPGVLGSVSSGKRDVQRLG